MARQKTTRADGDNLRSEYNFRSLVGVTRGKYSAQSAGMTGTSYRTTGRTRVWIFFLAALALSCGVSYVYGGLLEIPLWDATWSYGNWILRPELYLAPFAAPGAAAAFWQGMRWVRAASPWRRLLSGTVAAAFGALLVAPAGIRWMWIAIEAGRIELPPDAQNVTREIDVIAYDYVPDYSIRFVTSESPADIEHFYRDRFAVRGWSVTGHSAGKVSSPDLLGYRAADESSWTRTTSFDFRAPIAREKNLEPKIEIATARLRNGGTWVRVLRPDPSAQATWLRSWLYSEPDETF